MTRKPSRLRRRLKWAGLLACSVLLVAAHVGVPVGASYRQRRWYIITTGHSVSFFWHAWAIDPHMRMGWEYWWEEGGRGSGRGWHVHQICRYGGRGPDIVWRPRTKRVDIPYWCFAVAIAVPTYWLWYRDAPRPRSRAARLPSSVSLIGAAGIFLLAYPIGRGLSAGIADAVDIVFAAEAIETAAVTGLFVLTMLVPYIPARLTFVCLRWTPANGAGICAGCGYNLTGNLSGVCPECGDAT